MIPSEHTHRVLHSIIRPTQFQRPIGQFTGRRFVVKRRQRLAPFNLTRRHKLRNRERMDGPFIIRRINIVHRAVGRPQVDPNNETRLIFFFSAHVAEDSKCLSTC